MSSYGFDEEPTQKAVFSFAAPRRLSRNFPILLFVWGFVYWSYISVVATVLDDTLHRQDLRGSYYWGEFVIATSAILLTIWGLVDLVVQQRRYIAMQAVQTQFASLLHSFINALNPNCIALVKLVAADSHGGASPPVHAGVYQVARETCAMILTAMTMALWQPCAANRPPNSNEYANIAGVLGTNFDPTLTGLVPAQFSASPLAHGRWQCFAMTTLIANRFQSMIHSLVVEQAAKAPSLVTAAQQYMLSGHEALDTSIAVVNSRLDDFQTAETMSSWYLVSLSIKTLGVLYLLSLPWLLWLTSPGNDIAVCLLLFASVGSLILYDIYLGDVFLSPSTLHAGSLQTFIVGASIRADRALKAKFPTPLAPKIAPHAPHFYQPYQNEPKSLDKFVLQFFRQ